jgi:hypothetical protein
LHAAMRRNAAERAADALLPLIPAPHAAVPAPA